MTSLTRRQLLSALGMVPVLPVVAMVGGVSPAHALTQMQTSVYYFEDRIKSNSKDSAQQRNAANDPPVISVDTPLSRHAVPAMYRDVAIKNSIPAAILFAVAQQESNAVLAGLPRGENENTNANANALHDSPTTAIKHRRPQAVLPWPWTTNVRGVPGRYDSRALAEHALLGHLQAGTTSVDIGLMQVNWRYFKQRLVSPQLAFAPYWNLTVGASILRDLFTEKKNWRAAVGAYHAPNDSARAARYAASVMARLETTSPGRLHG